MDKTRTGGLGDVKGNTRFPSTQPNYVKSPKEKNLPKGVTQGADGKWSYDPVKGGVKLALDGRWQGAQNKLYSSLYKSKDVTIWVDVVSKDWEIEIEGQAKKIFEEISAEGFVEPKKLGVGSKVRVKGWKSEAVIIKKWGTDWVVQDSKGHVIVAGEDNLELL
jgi:hypothetical protein